MTYRYRMTARDARVFPAVILKDGRPLEVGPGEEVESPYHIDSPFLELLASPISEIVAAAPKAPSAESTETPHAQEA